MTRDEAMDLYRRYRAKHEAATNQNNERNDMNKNESMMSYLKYPIIAVTAIIVLTVVTSVVKCFCHKLENQNLAVVQSFGGHLEVRKTSGWWFQILPTITQYPKAGMYRLNAEDGDSLEIQFNNKSKAAMNAAIGYRIDGADDETIIALHQQVEGDDEKVWQMVLTALNTESQSITTKYDPSSVIGGEKFDKMVEEISSAIMHNPNLLTHGIDVNYFAVDGRPIPDEETEAQFARQKEADLARRLAEAEKQRLEAETIRTQAEYARQIAEQKGQAEAQMAKDVQSAEREKKIAEIEAQKKVEIEKLNKEQTLIQMAKEKEAAEIEAQKQKAIALVEAAKRVEVEKLSKEQVLIQMTKEKEAAEIEAQKQKAIALVEAGKLREVAEIQKQTEEANLEAIKLRAEQEVEQAKAKKQSIELSGAMSETRKAEIELQRQIAQYKWKGVADGLAGITLPAMVALGDGGSGNNDALGRLINTLTVERLSALAE